MKNRFIKILTICTLAFVLSINTSTEVIAQCPMCKMGAESNLKNGGTAGRGLNNGILYMLAMPYVMVATMGYIWYRNRKEEEEEESELEGDLLEN